MYCCLAGQRIGVMRLLHHILSMISHDRIVAFADKTLWHVAVENSSIECGMCQRRTEWLVHSLIS